MTDYICRHDPWARWRKAWWLAPGGRIELYYFEACGTGSVT